MNQEKNYVIAAAGFLIALLFLGFLFINEAESQEIEGPPEIDLWTGCCQPATNFDIPRNERDRGTRSDRDQLEEDLLERILRDTPTICLVTPVPIDDYYIGCLIRFEPEEARVDVWQ